MAAPIETELKLAVAERDLPRLLRRLKRFGAGTRRLVDSRYLDTPDSSLAGAGLALRLRRDGRRWVQTLKAAGAANAPLARRAEWEVPAPHGRLRIEAFGETPLARAMGPHRASDLTERFRTRFERTVFLAEHHGSTIEIAVDLGAIEAGTKREPIRELELELKSGSPAAVFDLALQFAGGRRRSTPLALLAWGDSKAARGRRLAAGEPLVPTKADAARLYGDIRPGDSAAAALADVVERGVAALLENVHGILRQDDGEFVHQARVAVRRVRVAIRALGEAAAFPEELGRELRWAGRKLGTARDWDVLVDETLPAAGDHRPELVDDIDRLRRAAHRRRLRARRAARVALGTARFSWLVLRLLQWAGTALTGPDGAAAPPNAATGRGRLAERARCELARAREAVARDGARFHQAGAKERHRTRVRVKRLRYLLELFAGVVPRLEAEHRRCVSLQSALGRMNDVRVARVSLGPLVTAARADRDVLRWLRTEERAERKAVEAQFAAA